MPLFCTLKNQYAGTNTPSADRFVNRGYPLMFEKDNKHMFYLDPEDETKTVQKFYGAPLTIQHNGTTYDGTKYSLAPMIAANGINYVGAGCCASSLFYNYNVDFGQSFNVISKIHVSDHLINAEFCGITLPRETQLSTFSTTTVFVEPLKHEGTISFVTGITVSNHMITTQKQRIKLPSETPITIKTTPVADDYPSNGDFFRIIYNVTKSSTNSHEITQQYHYVNLPEYHLGLLDSSQNVISETGNDTDGNSPYLRFWEKCHTDDGSDVTIDKIKFNDCKWARSSNILSITPKHNASHTLSTTSNTAQGNIRLSGAGCSGNVILKGSGGVTVRSNGSTITINAPTNTDYRVYTNSTDSTVYLSGKTTTLQHTGQEYINDKVYMSNGVLYSNNERVISVNESDGVVEVGKYLDFHTAGHFGNNTNGEDYAARLQDLTESKRDITLPANGGTLPVSNEHSSNSAGKLVTDIRIVTSLPSDASSYPTTLFLVTGGGVTEPTPEPTPAPVTQYNVSFTLPTGVSSVNINGTNYTNSPAKFNVGTNITWTFNTSSTDYIISSGKTGSAQLTSNYTITTPTVSRKYHLLISNRSCSNCELYSNGNLVLGNSYGNITTVTFNYNAYDGYNGPYGKYWEKDVYIDTNYSNVVVKSLYIAAKPASSVGYNKTFYCVYYVSGTSTISSAGSCNLGMSGDCFDISGKSIPHNNYMWQLYISESSNNITP